MMLTRVLVIGGDTPGVRPTILHPNTPTLLPDAYRLSPRSKIRGNSPLQSRRDVDHGFTHTSS